MSGCRGLALGDATKRCSGIEITHGIPQWKSRNESGDTGESI
jgi:hypothetical protein